MSGLLLWVRYWWMRQHQLTRCWPWCGDCRWAQQSWAAGEFYAHDDPAWYRRAAADPSNWTRNLHTTRGNTDNRTDGPGAAVVQIRK